jgi:hypothetical protein
MQKEYLTQNYRVVSKGFRRTHALLSRPILPSAGDWSCKRGEPDKGTPCVHHLNCRYPGVDSNGAHGAPYQKRYLIFPESLISTLSHCFTVVSGNLLTPLNPP